MTAEDARLIIARAVKRAWPHGAPFPDYWKKQTEWLSFHAPRISEKLACRFVADMIDIASAAEREGRTPEPWIVPESVKEIWRKAESEGVLAAYQSQSHKIGRSVPMKQGKLL